MLEYSLRFLGSELAPRIPDKAYFHVIPVGYEMSVSYGAGTAQGPEAILRASDQLELFDGTGCPGEAGIFTQQPVDCSASAIEDAPEILARVSRAVLAALDCNAVPVLLGGEHTITFGALQALKSKFGRIGVIQFDAHADLRDSYEGSRWSHACVMRRAVADLGLPLVQFGCRAYSLEESQARAVYGVTAWDAPYLARNPQPDKLVPDDFPEMVFLTFDVDGLDPSIIAETGTPAPGGLGWYQALDLAAAALSGRKLLGFDVVELAPRPGRHASDFAAASLVYALMGLALRSTT